MSTVRKKKLFLMTAQSPPVILYYKPLQLSLFIILTMSSLSYTAFHHPCGNIVNPHRRRFLIRVNERMTREQVKEAITASIGQCPSMHEWMKQRKHEVYQQVGNQLFELPSKRKLSTDVSECCICCEEGTTYVYQLVQCRHSFHISCLTNWLARGGKSCPCCRSPINITL